MDATYSTFVNNLTAAFLAGRWTGAGLRSRGRRACGGKPDWLPALVRRVLERFPQAPASDPEEQLRDFLTTDRAARSALGSANRVGQYYWVSPTMGTPAAQGWGVPALPTAGDLGAWLGLTPAQVDRLASPRPPSSDSTPELNDRRRHYRYRWLPKPGGKRRLLEVPKARLKSVQRRILDGVIFNIPAHEAAHGFRAGRSVLTYAAPHAGKAVVLRFDLRSFFASVRRGRVKAILRAAGYPRGVASLLAGVCTHRTPEDVWRGADAADAVRLRYAHLPQGAPTSPALANLAAYRLDCRLSALAQELGAAYTRYADDLAFSGGADLAARSKRLAVLVGQIALDEGFELNFRKTRRMRAGTRQHLAGVVVNDRPNCARVEYDRLKATLHNCTKHGPAGQNRAGSEDFAAHLRGRVAHVARLNPARGRKLLQMWAAVNWDTRTGERPV